MFVVRKVGFSGIYLGRGRKRFNEAPKVKEMDICGGKCIKEKTWG